MLKSTAALFFVAISVCYAHASNETYMNIATANASICTQLLQLAAECNQRLQDLGGGDGTEDDGQAGAFKACFNAYMKKYNENCR